MFNKHQIEVLARELAYYHALAAGDEHFSEDDARRWSEKCWTQFKSTALKVAQKVIGESPTVFIIAKKVERYVGKGEPDNRIELMPIHKSPEGRYLSAGSLSPAFTSEEAAEAFRVQHDKSNDWTVSEVELKSA